MEVKEAGRIMGNTMAVSRRSDKTFQARATTGARLELGRLFPRVPEQEWE